MIDRLEILHGTGFTHNDIKPENIVIDIDDKKVIHLIDFGLATSYVNKGKHI